MSARPIFSMCPGPSTHDCREQILSVKTTINSGKVFMLCVVLHILKTRNNLSNTKNSTIQAFVFVWSRRGD